MRTQPTALVFASSLLLGLPACLPISTQLADPTDVLVGLAPTSAVSADFNGDGKADLVVTRTWSRGEILVLLGNGDGTFAAPIVTATSGVPRVPCIVDLNGDGKPDLAVTDMVEGGYVSVLLGNGDGTFREPTNHLVGLSGSSPKSGDFNGDGKMDLAVVNFRPASSGVSQVIGGRLAVLLGHGDGTFEAARTRDLDGGPRGLAVGDWTGDGKLDIAIADESRRRVLVLHGNGDGTFVNGEVLRAGYEPLGISLPLDLNKDAKLDLVVHVAGGVAVFLNNGSGFDAGTAYSFQRSNTVSEVDLDKDGNIDLVGATRILRGDGSGHFSALAVPRHGRDDAFTVSADFNGDGWPDLAVTDFEHNRLSIYLNTGKGGGTAQLGNKGPLRSSLGTTPRL